MAKISIHIPDDVLERVRAHKDRLNISKVCSTALLKEVELISEVPALVKDTQDLIKRLQKEAKDSHLESFNLGTSLAQAYLSKATPDQLRYWNTLIFSERRHLVLPEEIENYLEQTSLDKKLKTPFHRPSFSKGWLAVMKQTWETVKDKI